MSSSFFRNLLLNMTSENIKRQGVASDEEENRCPAIEALKEVKEIEAGKFSVELAEGWKDLLSKVGEDDPALLVIWEDVNVDATVAALNGAVQQGVAPPSWLNPVPITREGLKMSILQHVREYAGCGNETEIVGNALIGPNTFSEYTSLVAIFGLINAMPFFRNHAVCPIGRIHVIADRRARTTAVAAPIPAHPTAGQVFA